MRKVKWRQRRIAAVVFGPNEIPVTPLPNPNTGPSFHTIQISDSWEPDYLVDLMVRDTNSYIVGFRRQKRKEGIWRKGTWYRYSNETMPSWIQATDLRFDSSHGDSYVLYCFSFFYIFASFPYHHLHWPKCTLGVEARTFSFI